MSSEDDIILAIRDYKYVKAKVLLLHLLKRILQELVHQESSVYIKEFNTITDMIFYYLTSPEDRKDISTKIKNVTLLLQKCHDDRKFPHALTQNLQILQEHENSRPDVNARYYETLKLDVIYKLLNFWQQQQQPVLATRKCTNKYQSHDRTETAETLNDDDHIVEQYKDILRFLNVTVIDSLKIKYHHIVTENEEALSKYVESKRNILDDLKDSGVASKINDMFKHVYPVLVNLTADNETSIIDLVSNLHDMVVATTASESFYKFMQGIKNLLNVVYSSRSKSVFSWESITDAVQRQTYSTSTTTTAAAATIEREREFKEASTSTQDLPVQIAALGHAQLDYQRKLLDSIVEILNAHNISVQDLSGDEPKTQIYCKALKALNDYCYSHVSELTRTKCDSDYRIISTYKELEVLKDFFLDVINIVKFISPEEEFSQIPMANREQLQLKLDNYTESGMENALALIRNMQIYLTRIVELLRENDLSNIENIVIKLLKTEDDVKSFLRSVDKTDSESFNDVKNNLLNLFQLTNYSNTKSLFNDVQLLFETIRNMLEEDFHDNQTLNFKTITQLVNSLYVKLKNRESESNLKQEISMHSQEISVLQDKIKPVTDFENKYLINFDDILQFTKSLLSEFKKQNNKAFQLRGVLLFDMALEKIKSVTSLEAEILQLKSKNAFLRDEISKVESELIGAENVKIDLKFCSQEKEDLLKKLDSIEFHNNYLTNQNEKLQDALNLATYEIQKRDGFIEELEQQLTNH